MMANAGTTSAAASLAHVARAQASLAEGQIERALEFARLAAVGGQDLLEAWLIFARVSDLRSDYAEAFAAYRKAMQLAPDPREILASMGKVALRLEEHAVAENILTMAVESGAGGEAVVDLAWSQIGQTAFDRAQATLTTALEAEPEQSRLWLTLGEMLCVAGRCAEAVVFFEEAIRLDPALVPAYDGLAEALFHSEDSGGRAMAESDRALAMAPAADRPRVVAGHGRRLLASGSVGPGLEAMAQWLEPGPAAGVDVKVAAGPWRPGSPIEGRLLVIGEAELGEEILFASVLPALEADMPDLILAIDPQWRRLAARSFPRALVVPPLRRVRYGRRQLTAELDSPHVHAQALVGGWTSLRSLLAAYRTTPADFAVGAAYLHPDPGRVAQWKAWLAALGPGPKVGVRWRAGTPDHRSWRQTPPLPALQAALSQPGLCVVPLQAAEEGEASQLEEAGVLAHWPPALDRSDLSDLAALCCALDLVVGAPDAVTHLAAACGAETCFLVPPRHWTLLGGQTHPWFPKARVIAAAGFNDWAPAMGGLAEALARAAA